MTGPMDEEWLGHLVDSSVTEEQLFRFLAQIQSLARTESLGPDDRLAAISQAITQAIGGNVVDATDWAARVTRGLIEP